jgi:CheY-like chemotaxis protein
VAQDLVRFTVWDSGIGIAATDMEHLFEPFVQIDSSLARRHEGTGLGLALVSRLAEMHGGGVLVESEVGRGSRFTISLPWPEGHRGEQVHSSAPNQQVPSNKAAPASSSPMSAHSSYTILLAEDNETNIIMTRDMLQRKGYQVSIARNGLEAIARAREIHPDIILMDIQMPELDGLETTRRIRAEASLAHIPIIALTALAMPGDRERCLAAGANDYLCKPVSLQELLKVIETQLQEVASKQ